MGQVTPDGTGDTMVRNSLSFARSRCVRFHLFFCEELDGRLLLAGEALTDFSTSAIAAEWGVAAIHAPDVWTEGYTGRGVTIAVVDSGVALAHPDLDGRLWSNADEISDNGRDDDGNGFIDDANGWDFLDADNWPDDPAGHGTHIAGIIAAGVVARDPLEIETDLTIAGAGEALGVAPGARVMPIRVLDGNLRGANRDIADGIRYAVDNGADIVNLSIGGQANSVIQAALEYAGEHDVLVVAAAGNNRASVPSQPAMLSNSLSNVLSASAFRKTGEREPSSNLVGTSGAVQVDAPGQAIRSTFVTAKYGYQSGTSMAAPHVAGLAALLLSANPSLSAAELRTIIVESAKPPATGSDSAGSVNAVEALALALQSPAHAIEEAVNRQPVAVESQPSAVSREPQLVISTPAAANPVVVVTHIPVTVAAWPDVLNLPPATGVPATHPSETSPVNQPETAGQLEAPTADYETARSLRDAALLAYRAETGGSAMSWPLDESDQPAAPEGRKTRKPELTYSAAAAVDARPRPADVAAEKRAAQ